MICNRVSVFLTQKVDTWIDLIRGIELDFFVCQWHTYDLLKLTFGHCIYLKMEYASFYVFQGKLEMFFYDCWLVYIAAVLGTGREQDS